MPRIRALVLGAFATLLFSDVRAAAQVQPFACFSASTGAPILRAESRSELIGDFLIVCSGGSPTPAGSRVPQFNIQIFLNTNVTSRLLEGPWSDALLLIDDPQPSAQLVCGGPSAPETGTGICSINGNGAGAGLYDGGAGHPNVFQGQMAGVNSIFWGSVPIDPPPFGQMRSVRLKNIRADTFALGIPASGSLPPELLMTVSSDGLPMTTAQVEVGLGVGGLNFSGSKLQTFQQCVPQNPGLATGATSNGVSQFHLTFGERSPAAFKPMNAAPVTDFNQPPPLADQNLPLATYYTETGFYNHLFPAIPGRGNLALAGLATQGTRLWAQFIDVPAGVKLFTNTTIQMQSPGLGVIRLVQTDPLGVGGFAAVPGNASGIASLGGNGPKRTAAFEVMTSDPYVLEQVNIPIYVAYASSAPSMPGLSTVVAAGGFGPLTASNIASQTDPAPRFAAPFSLVPAFTITSCQSGCGADISAQTSITRGQITYSANLKLFVQNVSIQNKSASAIQGPVSLALDNISSAVLLANPTGFTNCAAPKGNPYLNVNTGSDNVLSPGETAVVTVAFAARSARAIGYSTRVLAGQGNR